MELNDVLSPMLTVQEVAYLLNVHVNTVRRWSDNDILKAYRITPRGDRRFLKEDIARFLDSYNDFNVGSEKYRELSATHR